MMKKKEKGNLFLAYGIGVNSKRNYYLGNYSETKIVHEHELIFYSKIRLKRMTDVCRFS